MLRLVADEGIGYLAMGAVSLQHDDHDAGGIDAPRRTFRLVPASVGQSSLWFLRQVMPHGSAYNTGVQLRLAGELDARALEASVREIAQRHESCRTTFVALDGAIHQKIWETMPADVSVVDLTSAQDPEAEAQRLTRALASEPFDLEHGPLVRVRIFRIGARDHALVVVMDHIVIDGMSLQIWWRELEALYPALRAGEPSPLPPPKQFAECQGAQNRWLGTPAFARQLDYLTRHLEGAAPCDLPTDRPRPPVKSYRGGFVRSRIPSSVAQRLRAFSASEGVSTFTSLVATLDVLLARYSGQSDITTLVPFASRGRFGADDVMGYFANVVVLRVDVAEHITFRALLKQVGAEVMGGLSRQDVPFEKVINSIRPERSLSHDPLGSVGLSFLPRSASTLDLPGVEASFDEVPNGGAKFDLQFFIAETADDLTFCLEYNSDIFEEATIERMLGHYRVLLEAILTDPTKTIAELPILTPAEQRQVLIDWNATASEFPRDASIPSLVEVTARRSPDAIAASFEGQKLTYAELSRRSNQVARCLQARGVGPGVLVGIAVERSLDMLVGLLGISKAGGAYVPLDPAYPRDRLALMVEDSGLRVLLTEERLADIVPSPSVLRMDADRAEIAAQSDAPVAAPPDPESIAYVIYTSGSTGKPKGVEVPHRAVVNFLTSMAQRPGLSHRDRLLAVTSLSFDIAGLELWLPLTVGAEAMIVSRETAGDGAALKALLDSGRITLLQATPSTFRLLLEAGWKGTRGLKVLIGGEATTRELADQRVERADSVWNMYGPTETTIWSCVQPLEKNAPVLIGRPIANTQVYVLDRHLRPVPAGVTGEIYIAGDGVARGYLGRPELTRERFVDDPFSQRRGARMYRTGDLGRFRADGALDYLGRNDFQVKLRGYRIELGEIEATLAQHPSVREAVVVAYREGAGDPKLVAYVTTRAGRVEDTEASLSAALRAHLRNKLPEYMVPAHFMVLERLPLTANNKVDRKALPLPTGAAITSPTSTGRAPQDEVEVKLAAIFRKVLGLQAVGMTDSFFDLGGHSLLAVRLVAEIERELGRTIGLASLYQNQSIERIGALLRSGTTDGVASPRAVAAPAPVPAKAPRGEPHVVPASVGQASLWYLRQLMSCKTTYNVGVEFRLAGPLDADALEAAIREIVRRHESFRTTFRLVDGSVCQVISGQAQADVSFVDLSTTADPEAEAWRVADELGRETFDLGTGPLFRARILRLGPESHSLCVVVDHIVSDGVSLGTVWHELELLCRASRAGEAMTLPPPRKQFADGTVEQNAWLQTPEFARALDELVEQLKGAAPCDLPTDRPHPAIKSYRGGLARARIGKDVVDRIRRRAALEGVSLFSTLLSAMHVLLERYSSQSDIAILISLASQHLFGAEEVVGYFANLVPIRVGVTDEMTFRDVLKRVGAEVTATLMRPDVPFEKLIERLRPERSLSTSPISAVALSFLPSRGSALSLPGIDATFRDLPNGGSKFDLHLYVSEVGSELACTVEYNSDVFDGDTVDRLLGHYSVLLDAVVADPATTVAELPLLTPAERRRVLVEWNATEVAVPSGVTVHDLVTAAATRTPHAPAASFEGRAITYEELSRQSNRVARCLRARGVGPNVLVGIAVERSIDMLVGILAILKAGGAYVPLDPGYPRERLAIVAQDSGMSVLLTEARQADRVPAPAGLLWFDTDAAEIAAQSDEPLGIEVDPGSLAYVIFTSGSTGRPKGVPITHRSLVSFLRSMAKQPGMSPSDRLLAVISLSFDMAGFELWLPLMVGAHVEIASREMVGNATALRDRFEQSPRITVLQATPSTFRLLLETGWKGDKALKVVVGGEALARDLSEELLERAGSLWNGYGPTETTVFSTLQRIEKGAPVLIGRPIDNTQIYILDRNLQPVPAGVSGEIFIGGAGVARGYLGRPELTRERFIPDMFSGAKDALLYRTGDLARFRAGGAIDYQGRNDFQVKLRGYRIELGEVETTLTQHPSIREAVVVAYREGTGDPKLVAYVTTRSVGLEDAGANLSATLRAHLRNKLPEYMVPAHFMVLERLPLTANNKIDRKALPPPVGAAITSPTGTGRAPQDEVEVKLAAIFRKVLGLPAVGMTDSFFDLGGHSLLAVRLVAEIERVFGKAVPLVSLFRARSVEELAVLLRTDGGKVESFQLVPIQPVGTKRPLFLMSRPNVNALGYIALARYLDPDRPVYSMQYQYAEEQDLGRPYTYEEYDSWARSYVETMRLIQPRGPYLLGGMCEGAIIAFTTARVLEAAGEKVALLATLDAWPQENTVLRFPHRVYSYEVRLRAFAGLGRREQLRALVGALGRVVRKVNVSNGGREEQGAPTPVELLRQRLWPGKDFVPPTVSAKITVFRLNKQPYWRIRDRQYGWGNRTTTGVEVHIVPGDEHHNLLREPEVATTGRLMDECIRRADPPNVLR